MTMGKINLDAWSRWVGLATASSLIEATDMAAEWESGSGQRNDPWHGRGEEWWKVDGGR